MSLEQLEERSLLSIVNFAPSEQVRFPLPGPFVEFKGVAYFAASDGVGGSELWKSDGTSAGSALVKEIRPGAIGGYPQSLVNVNGTLFFTADDGSSGIELWKSDGTAAGTVLVKDILPGSESAVPFRLANINNTLFFSIRGGGSPGLWKSDGTAAGTVLVKDIGPADPTYSGAFTNVNGAIYFPGADSSGFELWKSNGTSAGTTIVRDLQPGPQGSYPRYLSNLNGQLVFAAVRSTYELWRSDGTSAGTVFVKSLSAIDTANPTHPSSFAVAGGKLYFALPEAASATNVWTTDGTTQGTVKVGGANAAHDLATVGDVVFFFDGPANSQQLWKISPGAAPAVVANVGSSPALPQPTNVDGTLYFVANDGSHGPELWKSDGTAGGTVQAKDLLAGATGSLPDRLTNINGQLFFVAASGAAGRVLWASVNANDAPRFTKGPDQNVTYKAGLLSIANWAKGVSAGPLPSEAAQSLTFQVSTDNPGLFATPPAVLANGTLTYAPALGAIGSTTVTVSLKDSGGTANGGSDSAPPQTFTIAVRAPGPRHNMAKPLDVSGDGKVVAGDSLLIINFINTTGGGPADSLPGPYYYDTSGDDFIVAGDVLLVINHINTFGPDKDGEGEALSGALNQLESAVGERAALGWDLAVYVGAAFDSGRLERRRPW